MDTHAPSSALDILDARLARMERCVFGAGATAARLGVSAAAPPTAAGGGVAGRARRLHANLPSLPLFESCVDRLHALKIDNEASLRRELSAPLDTSSKRALVLANTAMLYRLSAGGEAVGEMQGCVGGTAWHRARDEMPRIVRAEAASADLGQRSGAIMRRMDEILASYDGIVGSVTEKLNSYDRLARLRARTGGGQAPTYTPS